MRPLVRHFFDRFFDNEIVSPNGDMQTNVVQVLSLLATPGLLTTLWLIRGFSGVHTRYFFVSYSMIVMGVVMVFEWDALFPDRRDYLTLMPLPVTVGRVFAAKAAALCIFLGLFVADINLFPTLFAPIAMAPNSAGPIEIVQNGASLAAGVLGGGVFMALTFAGVQGVLINLLPTRAFRRISPVIQMIAMGGLVMLLLLGPFIESRLVGLLSRWDPVLWWYPCAWFLGLAETLQPGGSKYAVFTPLAGLAWKALLLAALATAASYGLGYRRHCRRVLESVETSFRRPGWLVRRAQAILHRRLLRSPVERGTFHFISQTITRSAKHRLFLATYAGLGFAVALPSVFAGPGGLVPLPLTLSFFLVSGLRAAFNFPAELKANWLFQITESEQRAEHLAATRKWIVACGVGPLFTLMLPMEFTQWPWRVALYHTAYGAALSLVLLQVMFFNFRKVPFTCAYFPGKVNLVALGALYLFGFTAYSWTMAGIEQSLLREPARIVVFFALAAAAIVLLSRRREREVRYLFSLDYEDAPDPVVRTLNIT